MAFRRWQHTTTVFTGRDIFPANDHNDLAASNDNNSPPNTIEPAAVDHHEAEGSNRPNEPATATRRIHNFSDLDDRLSAANINNRCQRTGHHGAQPSHAVNQCNRIDNTRPRHAVISGFGWARPTEPNGRNQRSAPGRA